MQKKSKSGAGLTAVVFFSLAASAIAFVLLGYQWPVGTDVGYLVNANTAQVNGELAAVRAAADSWDALNPAGLRMTYQGSTGVTDHGYNGANTVNWKAQGTNGTLATSYMWSLGGTMFETDLVFNDSYTWTTSGANYDIQTVSLHEFGHWVGLDHSSTGIMRAYYSGMARTIDTDARNGFEAMYGGSTVSARIELSRSGLTYFGSETESFDIRNSGQGSMNYSVSADRTWISVLPSSGISNGEWDTIQVVVNAAGLGTGTHIGTIRAASGDADNSPQTVRVSVEISNDHPPTVTITSPASGEVVGSAAAIRAEASDDHGVARVVFYVDNTRRFTDSTPPYRWDWKTGSASSGFHTIMVIATDTIGQTGSDSVNLKVDKPPSVSFAAPGNGEAVSGVVRIRAAASDDFGIRNVAFFINNQQKKKDNSFPYDYSWDTQVIPNGEYGIKALVTDSIGQTARKAIQVSILPHAPLNPTGEKKDNSSALLEEYINVLSWEANPLDSGITAYRVYKLESGGRTRIAEITADVFVYFHRNIEKDDVFTYTVRAVDSEGREGLPANINIQ